MFKRSINKFLKSARLVWRDFRYSMRIMEGCWEYSLEFDMNGIPITASAKVPYDTDWSDLEVSQGFINKVKGELPEHCHSSIVFTKVELVS